jgi:hypothetical protein
LHLAFYAWRVSGILKKQGISLTLRLLADTKTQSVRGKSQEGFVAMKTKEIIRKPSIYPGFFMRGHSLLREFDALKIGRIYLWSVLLSGLLVDTVEIV